MRFGFGQMHLGLGELQPVIRVRLALGDFFAGELPGRDGIAPDDALGALVIGDGLHLERVQLAEIGDLIEGQRGVLDQPDGGRLSA